MQARRDETTKATRARYTLEFKQEAALLVDGGQSIAAAAWTLDLVDQGLFNCVKAHRHCKMKGADTKPTSRPSTSIGCTRWIA
jgi:transposase